MRIRTLAELVEVSEIVRRMGPGGFNTAGMMSSEDAVAFNQEVIALADLHPDVPETTANAFERLRQLHAYGAFAYELYTMVAEQAPFVLELALGERFTSFQSVGMPLINKDGVRATARFKRFDEVYGLVRRGGPYSKGGWLLQLRSGHPPIPVPVGLKDLLRWAHAENLLRGQRNRRKGELNVWYRNWVAHPSHWQVEMPNHAARAIWELAETINYLWGHQTPGGRLYTPPIERRIIVVARNGDGGIAIDTPATVRDARYESDWDFTVLLAVLGDDFWVYNPEFETTTYPAECLLTTDSYQEVLDWLDAHGSETDTVDYLDRLFIVRDAKCGPPEWPRLPAVAAALEGEHRQGTWRTIRADNPADVFAHVGRLAARDGRFPGPPSPSSDDDARCTDNGPCDLCAVETLAVGELDAALAVVPQHRLPSGVDGI